MRILIVDDSGGLPDGIQGLIQRAVERLGESSSAAQAARFVVSSLGRRREGRPDRNECADLDLDDQPELLSTILDALGLALLHRGCLEEARPLIERALEIRLKLYGSDHPATAASLNSKARLLRQAGDFQSAESAARRALTINSRVFGAESFPVAISLNELAVIQIQLGDFTAAEQSATSGLRILEALHLDCTDPHVSRLLDSLGRVNQVRGNYEKATAIYTRVLDLDCRQVGKNHLRYATHLANFATVETAQGKLDKAKDHFEEAIRIYEHEVHRPRHPNLVDVNVNLASVLRQMGKPGEALTVLQDALDLDKEIRGDDHPFVGNDHARIGRAHYEKGDFSSALQSFGDALAIYEKNVTKGQLPADHAYIAEAQTWKGRVLVEAHGKERAAETESLLEDALKIWQVEFGERSVEQAIASAVLGHALALQSKDIQRARQLLLRSYPIVAAARGAQSRIAQLIAQWIQALPPEPAKKGA